ncbi:hypothetical protein GCM10027051_32410 [Niabella terrae]
MQMNNWIKNLVISSIIFLTSTLIESIIYFLQVYFFPTSESIEIYGKGETIQEVLVSSILFYSTTAANYFFVYCISINLLFYLFFRNIFSWLKIIILNSITKLLVVFILWLLYGANGIQHIIIVGCVFLGCILMILITSVRVKL